jgi:ABC-type lipoprotein export system ATPase subunit
MIPALSCVGLRHTYGQGEMAVPVLKGVDLEVAPTECAVLCGPSGSGKTTLLSIAGCLLTPGEGVLHIAGEELTGLGADGLVRIRREKLGFVFQHAHLLPFLSVEENLEIVGRNAGLDRVVVKERIAGLLERLEMTEHRRKKAAVLSGGQRQRVAVARALIHKPALVLADEPTAALGWEIGQVVVELLIQHARTEGAGLLVVTHDMRLLEKFDRVFKMEGGHVDESDEN